MIPPLSATAIVGVMVVVTALAVLLLRRLPIPTIVTYIGVGLLLGPVGGLLPAAGAGNSATRAVEAIGEVGIVLLLFIVGLELSLDRIRGVGRVAVFAGLGQVVFTLLFGFLLTMILGFTVLEGIFLATALTFSSTVVVVKLLDQKKELHTLYGRIAVGIFLVQDLVVIAVLTVLAGLAAGGGAGIGLDAGKIAAGLVRATLGMLVLLATALAASRLVLGRLFTWIAASAPALLLWSLGWCFVFVIGAEAMGLSPEIGAFLAGLSLAQLGCSHELRRRVHPLMSFFLAVFFVSLGASMVLDAAAAYWPQAIALSLFVLIGNPLIFMWIIARSGYGERTAFFTSVTVAQISEFSFVFAGVGMAAGLIGQPILSLVAIVGVVTIAISATMILYNRQLYEFSRRLGLLRLFRAAAEDPPGEGDAAAPMTGHVIVVGMNPLGQRVARKLHESGEQVLAVDSDPAKLAGSPWQTKVGNIDALAMVDEVNLAGAKLVVSALQIEDSNRLLAWRCRQLGVPVAIHAFDTSVIVGLKQLDIDFLIHPRLEGRRRLALELARLGSEVP